VNGTNVSATKEGGEPDHASNGGTRSVWYQWVAPATSSVTITTAGSSFDTMLSVFAGDDFTNLTLVAFNDTETNTSSVTFNAVIGTPYQIAVDGADGPAGAIALHLTVGPTQVPPTNDNFANRITLTGTHFNNVPGSNVGASKEPGEPFHTDAIGGKSVWWTWTAPSTGGLELATSGSSFDTLLALYTGDSVSNLTFVAGNDEDVLSNGFVSRLTCNVIAGTTYQIAVDGYEGDSGSIRLQLDLGPTFPVPANDNFVNRAVLTGNNVNATVSNAGASFEAIGADFIDGEPEHLYTFGGKSVWWTWTPTSSGKVTLTTSNSTLDTLIAVYTGTNLTNLVFVAGNDEDILSEGGLVSRATFNATNGITYQIVVDGYDGDSGTIYLQLRMGALMPIPSNNNFAKRAHLSGSSVATTGSNIGATLEAVEPFHNNLYGGKSVWWDWVAPGPGTVTVNTIGSAFDTLLAVYTGSSLSNLTPVASDDDSGGDDDTSLVTFYTKSGVTNYIAVDGYDGDSGSISLHLTFTQSSYSLTVNTNPATGGSVIVDPLPDQNGKYAPNSIVRLTALGIDGSVFTNWTGSVSNINNPLSLAMNANKTISGGFVLTPFKLTVYRPQTANSIQTDGFRLLLAGPTNHFYAIERSSNLMDWTSLQTNLLNSQQFEFQDKTAGNAPRQLYRARRLQ